MRWVVEIVSLSVLGGSGVPIPERTEGLGVGPVIERRLAL